MAEKPVASHILAVTTCRVPELTLATQWCHSHICPLIINQSNYLRLKP
jgi:hypothetical protein